MALLLPVSRLRNYVLVVEVLATVPRTTAGAVIENCLELANIQRDPEYLFCMAPDYTRYSCGIS